MDRKKTYRVMAAISAVVSILAVGTLSVVLVREGSFAAPVSGKAQSAVSRQVPEKPSSKEESSSYASAPRNPSGNKPQKESIPSRSAPSPSAQPAGTGVSQLLEGFQAPEPWRDMILIKDASFYIKSVHQAFLKNESNDDGLIMTVGVVDMEGWKEVSTRGERLLERGGKVYYCRSPKIAPSQFTPEEWGQMQEGLQAALKTFWEA